MGNAAILMKMQSFPGTFVWEEFSEGLENCKDVWSTPGTLGLSNDVLRRSQPAVSLNCSKFNVTLQLNDISVEFNPQQLKMSIKSISSFDDSFCFQFDLTIPRHEIMKFSNALVTHRSHYQTIDDQRFYANHRSTKTLGRPSDSPSIFQTFSKQEHAFKQFDSLSPELRYKCKLFTYESIQSGKRHFLVADMETFFKKYFEIPVLDRHLYEIIRETFPCRLYFDLEFSKVTNKTVDGNQLTRKWIDLVIWKLHDMFDIAIDYSNVVLLDSSTDEKFSKHVSFILRDQDVDCCREFLFAHNLDVGLFVQLLLHEITYSPIPPTAQESVKPFANTFQTLTEVPTGGFNDAAAESGSIESPDADKDADVNSLLLNGHARQAKPEYACFWLLSSSSDASVSMKRKHFFVDTGVYTRNRAFRIYGSCKYGKKKILGLTREDEAQYCHISGVDSSVNSSNSLSSGRSVSAVLSAGTVAQKRKDLLLKSFILPVALFKHSRTTEDPPKAQTTSIMTQDDTSLTFKLFSDYRGDFNQSEFRILPVLSSSGYFAPDNQSASRFSLSSVSERLSSFSVLPISPVLFPARGNLYASAAHPFNQAQSSGSVMCGGTWRQKVLLQSRAPKQPTPFTILDRYITWHYAQHRGTSPQGYYQSWSLFKKANGSFPLYILRYQIIGNRFCESIQRAHRSNGIYVDCDLINRTVRQGCWDVDCRHFPFSVLSLPEGVLSLSPQEIDNCIAEITRGPSSEIV